MLTNYKITLSPDKPCKPKAEWAYRLYAVLLENAPNDFANSVHNTGFTPISQYLHLDKWNITLMGEKAINALDEVILNRDNYYLKSENINFHVKSLKKEQILDVEQLFDLSATKKRLHKLEFITPTAFKNHGEYIILPTSQLIIKNLVKQWNICFEDCPIDDEDLEGLKSLADRLICKHFYLHDKSYYLKGNAISGFVGSAVFENKLNDFKKQLVDALMYLSQYTGIGTKTTLGMGAVKHKM